MARALRSSAQKVQAYLIERRRWVQGAIGISIYAVASALGIGIGWIIGLGSLAGLAFGKVFCRWACPIGFAMELMTGLGGDNGKFQQMYQYHKLGCPIAWASGFLNKYSLLRIRRDESSCTKCGLCDKACYISTLKADTFSLFKNGKNNPGEAYACSKCLSCVKACPTGSLGYRSGKSR